MNMVKVTIDVHGSPGKSDHTWSEFVLKILKMWHEKTLGVWSDLVDNSVILFKNKLELVVIHLEFVFLEQDNLGALWNVDSNSGQALSFLDQSDDL